MFVLDSVEFYLFSDLVSSLWWINEKEYDFHVIIIINMFVIYKYSQTTACLLLILKSSKSFWNNGFWDLLSVKQPQALS